MRDTTEFVVGAGKGPLGPGLPGGAKLPAAGPAKAHRGRRLRRGALVGMLVLWGPGLAVMLADTDAGSLVTAAQSGARWGYAMVAPQLVLIPVLYAVQEMTVRLGIVTGKGHGALIRERFGRGWAVVSVATLFLSATGALVTEFAGIAAVGGLFGLPRAFSVLLATALLVAAAMTGSYRRLERFALLVGLAELALVPAVVLAHPSLGGLARGLGHVPVGSSSYVFLLAANVGAVIMPWMVFYQQGAVIDKGLRRKDLAAERHDTLVGAVLTQLVMVMMVVLVAASPAASRLGGLGSVERLARALAPVMGGLVFRLSVGLAVLGAALVAAVVASLAGAWGLAEVFGWRHSLNERPSRQTAKFYATYVLAHVTGAAFVLASLDLVGLVVDVEVMNALLLPVVLVFLLLLEAKVLPPEQRMHGARRGVVTALCLAVVGFGLYMVPALM